MSHFKDNYKGLQGPFAFEFALSKLMKNVYAMWFLQHSLSTDFYFYTT